METCIMLFSAISAFISAIAAVVVAFNSHKIGGTLQRQVDALEKEKNNATKIHGESIGPLPKD